MGNALLTAVRAEIERHEQCLSQLHDIEASVLRLPGDDGEAGDAGRVVPKPTPRSGNGGLEAARNATSDQIYELVIAKGPLRRAQVHAELGGSINAIGDKLQRLARRGRIEAVGHPSRRMYRAPRRARARQLEAAPQPAAASRPATHPADPCFGPDDLWALIGRDAPVTSARLAELTGRTLPEIANWTDELVRRRAAVYEGEGPRRTWRVAPEPDIASQVAATIAAEPGALNERRIALSLRAAVDRVALACADLLDRGIVELTPEGTYAPVTA